METCRLYYLDLARQRGDGYAFATMVDEIDKLRAWKDGFYSENNRLMDESFSLRSENKWLRKACKELLVFVPYSRFEDAKDENGNLLHLEEVQQKALATLKK